MPKSHALELKRLEKQVSDLSDALAQLGSRDAFRRLIKLLRFPGWTTPAEQLLVSSIVESMTNQAQGLSVLKAQLLKGGELVVEGGANG